MESSGKQLLEVALIQFPDLSNIERSLLAALSDGRMIVAESAEESTVRAALVRWLCVSSIPRSLIHARGIRIKGVRIEGALDLVSVNCPIPLNFEGCKLPDGCDFSFALFPMIKFEACDITSLVATRVRTELSFLLNRCQIQGDVRLDGSRIGGHLRLDGARLSGSTTHALNLDSASISGRVSLMNGFRADGTIRVYGADIGKDLTCDGSMIGARDKVAIVVEASRIGGSIFFRRGYRAIGQVRLFGVTVNGGVDFEGARLSNSRSEALFMVGVKAGASVWLKSSPKQFGGCPLRCTGGVAIHQCTIGGNVDLQQASLRARRRAALLMTGTRTEGHLLASSMDVRGWVLLERISVKYDAVVSEAKICSRTSTAFQAAGLSCGGSLKLQGMRVTGQVDLRNVSVTDNLNASKVNIKVEKGMALLVRNAQIGGLMDWSSAVCEGDCDFTYCRIGTQAFFNEARLARINFANASIGSDLVLRNTQLQAARGQTAADLSNLECKGVFSITHGSIVEGTIDLRRAHVRTIYITDSGLKGEGRPALLGHLVRVDTDLLLLKCRIKGRVVLHQASITHSLDLSGTRISRSEGAALYASGISIGKSAILDSIAVFGSTDMARAEIGADFRMPNARVRSKSAAVSLNSARIDGDVFLGWELVLGGNNEARISGGFDMERARVGGHVDFSGAWLLEGRGRRAALHAEQAEIAGNFVSFIQIQK